MNISLIKGPGFVIDACAGWADVTERGEPFSLGRPDCGVGALQFSSALYRSGQIPAPSLDDLAEMVAEFAQLHRFGHPLQSEQFVERNLLLAEAMYHSFDEFICVWYLSDGKNIVLATYVCHWRHKDIEITDCDTMIKSLRFSEALDPEQACPPAVGGSGA